MSTSKKDKHGKDRVEKKHKKDKREKKKKHGKKDAEQPQASAFSLLANEQAVDPNLSSLFAAKPTPPQPRQDYDIRPAEASEQEDNDASLSEAEEEEDADAVLTDIEESRQNEQPAQRRRKRKHDEEDLEDAYMRRLAREEAKEAETAASERAAKRQKGLKEAEGDGEVEDDDDDDASVDGGADEDGADSDAEGSISEDEEALSPPPKHETEQAAEDELSKANRTVFLGNVSTAAISSKNDRKTLINHLKSFFESLPKQKDGESKHAVDSLRFRSTPYASAIPKKAAFATKQVMDATTKSTNAYAVYSSPSLARAAAKHLNGTVVLDRHLRVDEVAHPAKVDHKRCVFVGNLGFVDDESNIQAANEAEGKEKRKPSKQPADVEEGLWRTFGKCGTVESVRVIRDSTTRVGKGIAYVQFVDENGVEAALLLNEKKFPPMLPRKLRVSRAKAQKRNASKSTSGRPESSKTSTSGYKRKITGEEASNIGRTGKLYGRAAAAQVKKQVGKGDSGEQRFGNGIKGPEAFVFEGHRAKSGGGKSGLKLGGRKKKAGPTGRSAAYKAKNKAK